MEHNSILAHKSFLEINPIVIGIDFQSCFLIFSRENKWVPITEDTSVYILRLLEIDYVSFRRELSELLSEAQNTHYNISTDPKCFPFDLIVKTALLSERDHWIELSKDWLQQIGKNYFLEEIALIQKNKNISQHVRHALLKI